ncbi:MAG: DUF3021 domain-containing protein [Sarcina sp.]
MKYIKDYIKLFIKGIPMGVLIGQIIFTLIAVTSTRDFSGQELLRQNILAGIVGGYCYASSFAYRIENWSLLKKTVVQWLLLSIYLPFAWYIGWMTRTVGGVISISITYILAILIVWSLFRMKYKREANKLNEDLRKWNK